MKKSLARDVTRRAFLKNGTGAGAALAASLSAPAVLAQATAPIKIGHLNSFTGGIAYAEIAQQVRSGIAPSITSAVLVGVDHLATSLPSTIQALGITKDGLNNMVTGELGKLLAVAAAVPVAAPVLPMKVTA